MYLYGASGHGKVIKDILEAQGDKVEGFVDDNPNLAHYCEHEVYHKADGLSPVIVSIGINKTRKAIVEKLNCHFAKAIHPKAIVSPSAKIGEGTVVMPGAIINADAVIGKHCIINTGASVDHECVVGDYCHIAPHASLCGQVHLGEGSLIGVGASVIPCIEIGEWCTVGAGAAVVENVPDNQIVVGVPAKVLKKNDLITRREGGVGKLLVINLLQKPLAGRSCHAA